MKRILLVSFVALIVFAAASCAPSAKAVSTAVIGTVQAWTAIPSNTPWPTYTLPPTYTDLPTHTKLPTYTKQPTYTSFPSPTTAATDVPAGKSTPWPTYHTGTYEMESGSRWCVLGALQDSPRYIIVDLFCTTGPPAYNSGGLLEVLSIRNDVGKYTTSELGDTCTITFQFSYDTIQVTQESESSLDCGFGHNVRADGTYVLKSRARPRLGCSDMDDPCGLAG